MTLKHLFLLLAGLQGAGLAQAGGPLAVEGSGGNSPVHYSPASININFDIGPLGARTNAEADDLVLRAFALWNNVASSSLQLLQGNDLGTDVDVSNYTTFIPDTSTSHPANSDQLNPMVYDDDGTIIDDMFGQGASNNIAGFAASVYLLGDDKFQEGYAVINGKLSLLDSDIIGLVTHEMGHFIGLDHSQLDIDNTETDSGSPAVCTTQAVKDRYPIMYPFLCRVTNSLHADDIAALAALYPEPNNITLNFGQINGVLVDTNNNPVPGANIWLKNLATGTRYSIVSDYLLQNTGFFAVYLPPGDYSLHANSINPIFYGASSVGPYALSQTDVSFQNPVTAVSFQGSTPGSDEIINIAAGAARQVKFVIDGSGTVTPGGIVTPPASVPASTSSGAISLASVLALVSGLVLMRRRQVMVGCIS